jgi:glycyl-tRNA synthetase beta chain
MLRPLPTLKRQPDGKAEALFLDSRVARRDAGRGPAGSAGSRACRAADPEGDELPAADGWSSVNFVRPAHKLVALHGADVVPFPCSASLPAARPRATASKRRIRS